MSRRAASLAAVFAFVAAVVAGLDLTTGAWGCAALGVVAAVWLAVLAVWIRHTARSESDHEQETS